MRQEDQVNIKQPFLLPSQIHCILRASSLLSSFTILLLTASISSPYRRIDPFTPILKNLRLTRWRWQWRCLESIIHPDIPDKRVKVDGKFYEFDYLQFSFKWNHLDRNSITCSNARSTRYLNIAKIIGFLILSGRPRTKMLRLHETSSRIQAGGPLPQKTWNHHRNDDTHHSNPVHPSIDWQTYRHRDHDEPWQ